VLVASWVAGAVVGTMVAAGMFILKSLVNNTWSWGGFARSLLLGAVTGAATGGITGGMSASGFNGAVIVGSMNGAIAGGIDALFSKQNFFTGLYKGAVMGAAIGGIGYTINYFVNGYNKFRYKISSFDTKNAYDATYDPNISQETMQQNVTSMRNDNFTNAEINEFGVGSDIVGNGGSDGLIYPGDGSKVYAYTTPKNFLTGKSNIVYAPITAQNKDLLAATMVHETGHVYSQRLGLFDIQLKTDSSDHLAMAKLEHVYADRNLISKLNRSYNTFYTRPSIIDKMYNQLNQITRNIVDNTYDKLMPVFNRFMFYGK